MTRIAIPSIGKKVSASSSSCPVSGRLYARPGFSNQRASRAFMTNQPTVAGTNPASVSSSSASGTTRRMLGAKREIAGVDAVEPPLFANSPELVQAAIVEGQAGACDQILHGLRDEDLAGRGARGHPCAGMDGDACDLAARDLALAGV